MTKVSTKKNAVTLLKEDHKKIKSLLRQLASSREEKTRRTQLLKEIANELKIHMQIEEEIFYPAFKKSVQAKKDIKLYYEALEEHHMADIAIAEIKKTQVESNEFAAKAKVIKDLVEHHIEEEEEELFPRAKNFLSKSDLLELGEELKARKAYLAKKT